MKVTGIAHPPARLHEGKSLPSSELVYLAVRALVQYRATYLFTGLTWGWEQALATAANELKIPYTVAIPYPGRECDWPPEVRLQYLDLLARAKEVYRTSERKTETAVYENHCWQIDQMELVLALWDFDFETETFSAIRYSIKEDRQVVNLWHDWEQLYSLRLKNRPSVLKNKRNGAQVYKKEIQ